MLGRSTPSRHNLEHLITLRQVVGVGAGFIGTVLQIMSYGKLRQVSTDLSSWKKGYG